MGGKVPYNQLAQKTAPSGTRTILKADNITIVTASAEVDKIDAVNFDYPSLAVAKEENFAFRGRNDFYRIVGTRKADH